MRSFRETRKGAAEDSAPGRAPGAEELINKYSGMSENGLMRELNALTEKQRAEGSFDKAAIERQAQAILPMLSAEQQKKLKTILEGL